MIKISLVLEGVRIGLAEDLQKGLIERFRALPMARSAVLTGRTTADMVRNVFTVIIITGVGLAVGFRPTTGALAYTAGILIILLFATGVWIVLQPMQMRGNLARMG